MKKIDYLGILKKSWNITWHNKYLWWFGFFLALGSGGGSYNFPAGSENTEENGEKIIQAVSSFIETYWVLLLTGLLILIVLFLVVVVLKIISRAGLIKSVDKINKGETSSFKEGFSQGKKYFWKILFTGLLLSIFVMAVIAALASPVVLLVILKSYILAVIMGIMAVLIIIILAIIVAFIREYAYIYLVLSDIGIKPALENAYSLFRKNILPSIILALIFIPIGIVVGIGILMVLILLALIFVMIGLALYFILSKIGVVIAITLGVLVFLVVVLFIQSVFQTFRQAVWVLFFKEIASVEKEDIIKEAEIVKAEGKVLDAEGA